MKRLLPVLLAFAPALAIAAAGHTSYSSYMTQVPAPPRDAETAYKAVIINQAAIDTGGNVINQPPAFTNLTRKLEDESRLASSTSGASAAIGITDEASALALQQQMQNMTPAQQMAMAQQMAGQMNASMQSDAAGPEDQAVLALLDKRQGSSMQRIQASTRLQQDWTAMTQKWEQAHTAIEDEKFAALDRTPSQCARNSDMDYAALKVLEQYSEKHLALVRNEFKDGIGIYERRRVLTTDEAGFADQLAPKMQKAKSPPARQGYAAARQDAIRGIGDLEAISWKMHEHGATWWLSKLDTRPARRCAGAG